MSILKRVEFTFFKELRFQSLRFFLRVWGSSSSTKKNLIFFQFGFGG
jgi:hypothetical protein